MAAEADGLRLAAAAVLTTIDPLLLDIDGTTCLVGNADVHGKNLALLHPGGATVTLAPLYDTVPTVLWPKLRADAAMAVGGTSALAQVSLDDIAAEAKSWNHPADRAREMAIQTVATVVEAVDSGALADESPVAPLVRARAARLLK